MCFVKRYRPSSAYQKSHYVHPISSWYWQWRHPFSWSSILQWADSPTGWGRGHWWSEVWEWRCDSNCTYLSICPECLPLLTHATEQATVPPKVSWAVQYSKSWMHNAIMARQATEYHMHNHYHELTLYLNLPLEETNDIVAWWRVSLFFYLTHSQLTLFITIISCTYCSIQHLLVLHMIIYQFKVVLFPLSTLSLAEVSRQPCAAMLWHLPPSLHYSQWRLLTRMDIFQQLQRQRSM